MDDVKMAIAAITTIENRLNQLRAELQVARSLVVEATATPHTQYQQARDRLRAIHEKLDDMQAILEELR